jgi:hypothetical protein
MHTSLRPRTDPRRHTHAHTWSHRSTRIRCSRVAGRTWLLVRLRIAADDSAHGAVSSPQHVAPRPLACAMVAPSAPESVRGGCSRKSSASHCDGNATVRPPACGIGVRSPDGLEQHHAPRPSRLQQQEKRKSFPTETPASRDKNRAASSLSSSAARQAAPRWAVRACMVARTTSDSVLRACLDATGGPAAALGKQWGKQQRLTLGKQPGKSPGQPPSHGRTDDMCKSSGCTAAHRALAGVKPAGASGLDKYAEHQRSLAPGLAHAPAWSHR